MMTINRNHRKALSLIGLFVVLAVVCLLAAGAEKMVDVGNEFATFRQREMVELEAKFSVLSRHAANTVHVSAAKDAVTEIESAVAEAVGALERVRASAVSGMVNEAIGAGGRRPARIVPSQADSVRNTYIKHNAAIRRAVAVAEDKSAEDEASSEALLVRQYIDAALAAAQKYIFIQAGELEALGDGVDAVAAEWATLVPLFRYDDSQWNKELVNSLPGWMRKMSAIRASEYVCLAAGRPGAAYQLWICQVSGDEAALDVENYLANLGRRANAYFGSKDFLKGFAVLKAAIILADAEGRTDEAVTSRFRLAEAYVIYGHAQEAANELKIAATAYPGHKEHGKVLVMRFKYLYEARLYDRILEEISDALADKAAAEYRPNFLYIAWTASRHKEKHQAADEFQKQFLREYPNHPFCADIYFATATTLLNTGQYDDAARLLEMVIEKYPRSPIVAKCRIVLTKVKANQQRASESAGVMFGVD